MSEENTKDVVPAVLAEGEAVIPTEKVEEFNTLVEEIVEAVALAEEVVPEAIVETTPEPTVSVVEETVEDKVISSKSQKTNSPSDFAAGLTDVVGGVIGTGAVKRKPAAKKPEVKAEQKTVALHSTKNVSWSGVGKVYRGYNIVSPVQAEKWLTKSYIRTATPEEVAQEFGR